MMSRWQPKKRREGVNSEKEERRADIKAKIWANRGWRRPYLLIRRESPPRGTPRTRPRTWITSGPSSSRGRRASCRQASSSRGKFDTHAQNSNKSHRKCHQRLRIRSIGAIPKRNALVLPVNLKQVRQVNLLFYRRTWLSCWPAETQLKTGWEEKSVFVRARLPRSNRPHYQRKGKIGPAFHSGRKKERRRVVLSSGVKWNPEKPSGLSKNLQAKTEIHSRLNYECWLLNLCRHLKIFHSKASVKNVSKIFEVPKKYWRSQGMTKGNDTHQLWIFWFSKV